MCVQYKVSESRLPSRVLWLSVWDWDRIGHNDFLGEVKIPLIPTNLGVLYKWYTLQNKVSIHKLSYLDGRAIGGNLFEVGGGGRVA